MSASRNGIRHSADFSRTARGLDVDAGRPELTPTSSAEIPAEGLDPITSEFFEYYALGARHIDLYDGTDLIPFDTLESFFAKILT